MTALPREAVLGLARDLIAAPSQGGIDSPAQVLGVAAGALDRLGLGPRLLHDDAGEPVALLAEIEGGGPGPTWVLNACIDTAPAGDRGAWSVDPFAGVVQDGWLYGRGSGDSKIAVATFCHLAARLELERAGLNGRLILLFDADEHTGRFGGIKRFIAERPDVAGVMVGYPENTIVNTGARGFWRATIEVYGTAQHSGAAVTEAPSNAAVKLAALIQLLAAVKLPPAPDGADFPLPPKLTVTGVSGGAGFSMVPNACALNVDIRLTPAFDATAAAELVGAAVEAVDHVMPSTRPTKIDALESWGPYRLAPDDRLGAALVEGAGRAAGRAVPGQVCGPSNIGNYLADRGIPATCGFGVTCEGIHGADERIEIASIPLVWDAYGFAIRRLMA
jgi:succinyl-diaminopimelate desuccinylase